LAVIGEVGIPLGSRKEVFVTHQFSDLVNPGVCSLIIFAAFPLRENDVSDMCCDCWKDEAPK